MPEEASSPSPSKGGSSVVMLEQLKTSIQSISYPLLKLKFGFFFVYAVWFSAFPYVSLISTQIISFKQLAIIHACIPITSIIGPIVTGYVADKIGNYKVILCGTLMLGALVHLPVLWLQSEHKRFLASLNRTNESMHDDDDLSEGQSNWFLPQDLIFSILLIIRLLNFYAFDTTNSLLDSSGFTMTKKHGGDFGQQKMWSMFSMVLVPLFCGTMIDLISEYRGFKDTSIAFYISAGAAITVVPLILQLDVEVHRNKESLIATAGKVIKMIDVDFFLLVQVVVGICFGWHRSFLVVYADAELKASKTLLGAAFGIGGIGSMFMFSTAKLIIGRLGAPNTVVISLAITATRFISYYFLTIPWLMLISESVDGLSGFLAIVAGSYFCAEAAPAGMLASLNGILTAAIFGAGRGIGLTLGSLLIAEYGIRFAYLTMGILAGATALLYVIAYHSFLKKVERKRILGEKEPSKDVAPVTVKGVDNLGADYREENLATSHSAANAKHSVP